MGTANPLVIPAGYAEITHRFSLMGDPEVMTWSHGAAGVTDSTSLADAVGTWAGLFVAGPNGALSDAYTYMGATGRTDPAGSNLVFDLPEAIAGAGGADSIPQNCALIVRKRTATGGRANSGRIFQPGMLTPGDVDNAGNIAGATVTALQSTWDTFLSDGAASTFDMVLLHSKFVRDPADPPPATTMMANPHTTPSVVTALTVEPIIATQRRRLR